MGIPVGRVARRRNPLAGLGKAIGFERDPAKLLRELGRSLGHRHRSVLAHEVCNRLEPSGNLGVSAPGLEGCRIERFDLDRDKAIRVRSNTLPRFMIVAGRHLAGPGRELQPIAAIGLLPTHDDLVTSVRSDHHLVVADRRNGTARCVAIMTSALDGKRRECCGSYVAANSIGTIVPNRREVVDRIRVIAEKFPSRGHVELKDGTLRVGLEPKRMRSL